MVILHTLCSLTGSAELLLFLNIAALSLKTLLIVTLITKTSWTKTPHASIIWLLIAMVAAALVDCYYITHSLQTVGLVIFEPFVKYTLARSSWIANIIFQITLSLFIESLLREKSFNSAYKIIRALLSVSFCSYFVTIEFFPNLSTHIPELKVWQTTYWFLLIVGLTSLLKITHSMRTLQLPTLLKYQLKLFTFAFILPFLTFKFLITNPITWTQNSFIPGYMFNNITTAILTWATYYCTFKLVGLRFLNAKDHITESRRYNFVETFKKIIGRLGNATTGAELKHIVQQFFSETFTISSSSTRLIIHNDSHYDYESETQKFVSTYLASSPDLKNLLGQARVITRDEVDFSAYYEQHRAYKEAATFLRALKADVFVPIYDKHMLSGFIIVEENARKKHFFNETEQNEMAVFAAYLSSVINLIRNRSLDSILAKEKLLEEELFHRHQEIKHYRENNRTFLQESSEKKIGILFYRSNKFSFGNQTAQDFISCDPNVQQGHPLSQALRKIAQQTEQFKSTQTVTVTQEVGKMLSLSALPSLENNHVIIIVTRPDMADIVRLQTNALKDPSQWDYVLYLGTTESGQMVNQLIPGSGPVITNFKIELLRTALGRSATLIEGSIDDQNTLVNLLHTVSLRKQLYTLTIAEPEKDLEYGIALFGISPLFGPLHTHVPILEELNEIGTLFIKGIHLLAPETQKHLAEFLQYGAFRRLKSEQRIFSNVRIICSSEHDLAKLAHDKLFSIDLLQELSRTTLKIPNPCTLPREEFDELAQGFFNQFTEKIPLKKMLSLDKGELSKLFNLTIKSIDKLKAQVHEIVLNKSNTHHIKIIRAVRPDEDSELNAILLLGKKALKNQSALSYLWTTFKSQTKIATLLGVNRSSVNRRCKEFNLS